ncbi:hypothetical protein [Rhodopirellula sp. MGV]|uniref:hypothetical protein n=1 Tax=Rhodopirellula sp. MGV TaxID=2023130 RepID=UPI000B95DAF6|nr:hypothetical protein [Rhodopirellula sp. MGV]OYP30349.1 hypothetical protein CGZ80_22980 [Rhodopirellula sp. MGV]PNY34705.1 hypothetical protein C2E31_22330 [Rhodopirellula baltica]
MSGQVLESPVSATSRQHDDSVSADRSQGSIASVTMPEPGSGRVFAAYLVVQCCLFIGLVWKYSFFYLADQVYRHFPISDSFFPEWLQSPDVARNAYIGSLSAIILGVFGLTPWMRTFAAMGTTGCLGVLLLHQSSHNDMTFATSAWVSLWVCWLTTRMSHEDPYPLLRRAAFLARVICSMILLGGAVGKWTPEYWSGEVFYDIYFVDRDFWVFNLMRERFDTETLKTMAMWYSRKVILVESIAGLGMWLLPARWAAFVGVTIFFSIAFLSNPLLFSVLTCLVGLSAVGFFVPAKTTLTS